MNRTEYISLILIFILGAILRILVSYHASDSPLTKNNFDINSYIHVGYMTLTGGGISREVEMGNHPYFPFMMFIEALVMRISISLNFRPELLFRLLFSLTDALIILPIYYLSKNWIAMLIYTVNPVTILISSYQGQFDSIPVFFLLTSFIYLKNNKLFKFYFWANLAVTVKTWPLIFLSSIICKYRKPVEIMYLIILPTVLTVLYSILYKVNPLNILVPVSFYRGFGNSFGIGMILQLFHLNNYIQTILSTLYLIILFIISLKTKTGDIIKDMTLMMLLFFLFTPTFAVQWLLWPIAFMLINHSIKSFIVIIPLSFYVIINYLFPQISNSTIINLLLNCLIWIALILQYKIIRK